MSPLINLLHLKFFYDAVNLRSISQAAKINFVTQSAVSQGIIKLTKIIGSDLIYHNKQGLQLTSEGKVVFENTAYIFKAVQNTFDEVQKVRCEVKTQVKFVTTRCVGLSYIPTYYHRTIQNISSLDLQFKMGELEFIRESLVEGDAEFAIAIVDDNFVDFERHVLFKGYYHLYQAKHASKGLLDKGILIDHAESKYVKEFCEEFNLSIQMELMGWDHVARFTELGMGVGFLPDFIVNGPQQASLQLYPKEIPVYEYEISVVYLKDRKLSQGAQVFIDQFCNT